MIITTNETSYPNNLWVNFNDGTAQALVDNTHIYADLEAAFSDTVANCPGRGHKLKHGESIPGKKSSKLFIKNTGNVEVILAITRG